MTSANAHIFHLPFSRDHLPSRTIEDMDETSSVTKRSVHRWLQAGAIPFYSADEFACKCLGMHPALIWGPEYWTVSAQIEAWSAEKIIRKRATNLIASRKAQALKLQGATQ